LYIQVCIVSYYLYRRLVCSNRTVGTQAPEFAAYCPLRCGLNYVPFRKRQIGHIIDNSNCKVVFGSSCFKFSNTDMIWDGLVSFEPSPYLPPTITGLFSFDRYIFETSRYKGSPGAPGSLVLSSTAIFFTVFGITSKKYFSEKGL